MLSTREKLADFFDGICAGILITIGCAVYLACENKVVGAVLFSVALLCICIKGFNLFTGKIGFMALNYGKSAFSTLLLGLLGNAIGTVIFGYALKFAMPSLSATAEIICEAKLTQSFLQTLIRGMFCGILMYLAVSIYKDNKTVVGIVFCIPVFILSGFEHSIADIGYFAIYGVVSLEGFLFLMTVILGNTLGALILPLLIKYRPTKES